MGAGKRITFEFLDKDDKKTTQKMLRNLKYKTGEDCPVVLNKALRLYKKFIEVENMLRSQIIMNRENLHLILTAFWFNEIDSKRKFIDYRIINKHWKSRIEGKTFDYVVLHYAYTSKTLIMKWIKTEKLESGINTDLKTDEPVYAIYFEALKNKVGIQSYG